MALNAATDREAHSLDKAALRQIPLLADLTSEQQTFVANELRLRSFAKRETVLIKGSVGENLLFLLSGQLQVVDVTEDGRAIGLNLFKPGDFFGEIAVIDGGPRSATVTALTKCSVGFLPRSSALWMFSHCSSVAEKILQHMAQKIRRDSEFRIILGNQNAFKRVFALLESMKQLKPGGLFVVENLPTQQDIAIMINTSRETVSRALASLIERGVVEKDMRRFIVRKPEELTLLAENPPTRAARQDRP